MICIRTIIIIGFCRDIEIYAPFLRIIRQGLFMYPRGNRSAQKGNGQQPDKDLSADLEADELQNGADNEISLLGNIIAGASNEANNKELDDDSMAHYSNNDLNRLDSPKETGLSHYLEDDLNRLDSKKNSKKGMSEKELPDENAAGKVLNLIEPLIKEEPDDLIRNEEDILPIAAGKNKNGSRKKSNAPKAAKNKKPDKDLAGIEQFTDLVGEEDIAHVSGDMEPVKGLNFEAQSLPARKNKPGKMRRFFSRLAYYGGKTFGSLFGLVGKIVAAPYTLVRYIQLVSRRSKNKKQAQDRNRKAIPGWDGRNFEETVRNDKELDIDFRKVPAVWSYPTAEKAVDDSGNPRPPMLSVYVTQPDENRDQTMNENGNTGHTGIGIEYSRYSKTSGEWERYNLRYGFYPAGGLNTMSTQAVLGYEKANIPGQLLNEKGNSYNISRAYPATPKQINAVLDASVPYADKGYNNYTRNCTSFAKAMMLDVAHIPGGEEIFARDEIRLNTSTNAKIFGASMAALHFETGAESDLNKLITGDDSSYMNFGSKRMTASDYKNYRNSLSFWKRRPSKADSPNAVAENIRRLQGADTGVISKWINRNQDSVDIPDARDKLRAGGLQLKGMLEEIAPDSMNKDSMSEELTRIIGTLDDLGQPIAKITYQNKPEYFSRAELREMRSGLSEYIGNLNTLLYKYYKNDRRLHYNIMDLTHYMNDAIAGLDEAYDTVSDQADLGGGDLGTLRQEMTKYGYMISSGGTETGMTPSLYEAYLQIFKTPREAVKKYARYMELKNKPSTGGKLSDAERKEFEKLSRVRNLAGDFDRSHRYMLEKDSYSQQDIDYAFDLKKKEKDNAISLQMNNEKLFASDIYQSLFLEKVFGGLKQRFTQALQAEPTQNGRKLKSWLDQDLAECVKNRPEEIVRITRALVKDQKYPMEDTLFSDLWYLIKSHWINRLFNKKGEEKQREQLQDAWSAMSFYGKLDDALRPIVRQVISEQPKEKEDEDDDVRSEYSD